MAISLFLWGCFLLVGSNLGEALGRWRSEARIVVYLRPDASEALRRQIERRISESDRVRSVRVVSATEARRRFRSAFPSLADVLGDGDESPLPASLEVALTDAAAGGEEVAAWLRELAALPGVDLVDDDRDWLDQLRSLTNGARVFGLAAGLILLAAATVTIASVIRLAALMYQDEISIMRMVGATEFLIRGPFYCEGFLQGAIGAGLATAGLWAGYSAASPHIAELGVLGDVLMGRFLSPGQLALLVGIGCFAGTFGAVISLKGEALADEEG